MPNHYLDSRVRTWCGRNNLPEGRLAADPRAVGMKRHKLCLTKTAAHIKAALLYNQHTGEEIQRSKNGEWV